jgi:hypothetical protein
MVHPACLFLPKTQEKRLYYFTGFLVNRLRHSSSGMSFFVGILFSLFLNSLGPFGFWRLKRLAAGDWREALINAIKTKTQKQQSSRPVISCLAALF